MVGLYLARNSNKDLKKFSFYQFKRENRATDQIKTDKNLARSNKKLINFFNVYFVAWFTKENFD